MPDKWQKILVGPKTSVIEAMKVIDATAMQLALVVDENNLLLGTITDGDIRRSILKGQSLQLAVKDIMHCNPTVANASESRNKIFKIMKQKCLRHIPLIDDEGLVVGLVTFQDIVESGVEKNNIVVLMAGGLGTRLKHLTANTPKPMLKVGDKPILETILENFIEHGFNKFLISVNYKSELIENYFGDGSQWGVQIEYLREDKKLGTAGALGLMPEKPILPVIVMNGDVLTKVNFNQLITFHSENKSVATMCVREYDYQVPFGVVKLDQHRILSIEEKPVQRFFVNAGIYVLEPEVLEMIPHNNHLDMPSLFELLIRKGMETSVFPIREYWLDIGRIDDFDRANGEYREVF
jgi:dTDP-glucose pyrophosphorylase/CBS domain-containing protein